MKFDYGSENSMSKHCGKYVKYLNYSRSTHASVGHAILARNEGFSRRGPCSTVKSWGRTRSVSRSAWFAKASRRKLQTSCCNGTGLR
ncbi:uncharacterized protein MEPE_02336 [Melanopsichium pennsylvanicum]|uniref:Uncharacterized protein n=1 Tax=Melanopsichium pennsylvanicum TaxID=63383 RepID=A0AAJ4XJQ8_9BASI|nr:uncharacterized protein MEPE_02336 [Melanopsichium pennsylvanicum]